MAKKALIAVAVLLLVLVAVIATRPATYHVERSVQIQAPVEAVFAVLADQREFPSWSPWQKLDPNIQTTFSGTPTAVGGGYAWHGNEKVGKGSMTITEVVPGIVLFLGTIVLLSNTPSIPASRARSRSRRRSRWRGPPSSTCLATARSSPR